ncbi:MAG: shikimate dehydrogenase [Lachnospiraceae bacterium]|nr:shikimate dehydrogenase [Lachnospiraceae bacterium]
MIIDGNTRTCGLLGNPVSHTLSPLIHNTLASRMGVQLAYVPFLVKEDLEAAVKGAYALNLLGLNVTVPYKSEVIPHLASCDPLARQIGAVNTLVRQEHGFRGYNTDISGLYRAMISDGVFTKGQDIILLGAGGAARAAAFLCAHYGAHGVYLMNRSRQKAQALAQAVNDYAGKECVIPLGLEEYDALPRKRMLCIQATSVGLDSKKAITEDRGFYEYVQTGYDLVYQPFRTRFMELTEEAGGRAFNGLKMLLYQGVEAFELWNHCKVPRELAEELYDHLKEVMGIHE